MKSGWERSIAIDLAFDSFDNPPPAIECGQSRALNDKIAYTAANLLAVLLIVVSFLSAASSSPMFLPSAAFAFL